MADAAGVGRPKRPRAAVPEPAQNTEVPAKVAEAIKCNDLVPALFALPCDSDSKKLKLCKRVGWWKEGAFETGYMEINVREARQKGLFDQPRRVTLVSSEDAGPRAAAGGGAPSGGQPMAGSGAASTTAVIDLRRGSASRQSNLIPVAKDSVVVTRPSPAKPVAVNQGSAGATAGERADKQRPKPPGTARPEPLRADGTEADTADEKAAPGERVDGKRGQRSSQSDERAPSSGSGPDPTNTHAAPSDEGNSSRQPKDRQQGQSTGKVPPGRTDEKTGQGGDSTPLACESLPGQSATVRLVSKDSKGGPPPKPGDNPPVCAGRTKRPSRPGDIGDGPAEPRVPSPRESPGQPGAGDGKGSTITEVESSPPPPRPAAGRGRRRVGRPATAGRSAPRTRGAGARPSPKSSPRKKSPRRFAPPIMKAIRDALISSALHRKSPVVRLNKLKLDPTKRTAGGVHIDAAVSSGSRPDPAAAAAAEGKPGPDKRTVPVAMAPSSVEETTSCQPPAKRLRLESKNESTPSSASPLTTSLPHSDPADLNPEATPKTRPAGSTPSQGTSPVVSAPSPRASKEENPVLRRSPPVGTVTGTPSTPAPEEPAKGGSSPGGALPGLQIGSVYSLTEAEAKELFPRSRPKKSAPAVPVKPEPVAANPDSGTKPPPTEASVSERTVPVETTGEVRSSPTQRTETDKQDKPKSPSAAVRRRRTTIEKAPSTGGTDAKPCDSAPAPATEPAKTEIQEPPKSPMKLASLTQPRPTPETQTTTTTTTTFVTRYPLVIPGTRVLQQTAPAPANLPFPIGTASGQGIAATAAAAAAAPQLAGQPQLITLVPVSLGSLKVTACPGSSLRGSSPTTGSRLVAPVAPVAPVASVAPTWPVAASAPLSVVAPVSAAPAGQTLAAASPGVGGVAPATSAPQYILITGAGPFSGAAHQPPQPQRSGPASSPASKPEVRILPAASPAKAKHHRPGILRSSRPPSKIQTADLARAAAHQALPLETPHQAQRVAVSPPVEVAESGSSPLQPPARPRVTSLPPSDVPNGETPPPAVDTSTGSCSPATAAQPSARTTPQPPVSQTMSRPVNNFLISKKTNRHGPPTVVQIGPAIPITAVSSSSTAPAAAGSKFASASSPGPGPTAASSPAPLASARLPTSGSGVAKTKAPPPELNPEPAGAQVQVGLSSTEKAKTTARPTKTFLITTIKGERKLVEVPTGESADAILSRMANEKVVKFVAPKSEPAEKKQTRAKQMAPEPEVAAITSTRRVWDHRAKGRSPDRSARRSRHRLSPKKRGPVLKIKFAQTPKIIRERVEKEEEEEEEEEVEDDEEEDRKKTADPRRSGRERRLKRPYSPPARSHRKSAQPRKISRAPEATRGEAASPAPAPGAAPPAGVDRTPTDHWAETRRSLMPDASASLALQPPSPPSFFDRDDRVRRLKEMRREKEAALEEILQRRKRELEERLVDPQLYNL